VALAVRVDAVMAIKVDMAAERDYQMAQPMEFLPQLQQLQQTK
jgi:hypothetical protein